MLTLSFHIHSRAVNAALILMVTFCASPAVAQPVTTTPVYQMAQATTDYRVTPYADTLKKHVDSRGNVNYANLKRSAGDLVRYTQILARTSPSVYQKWPAADKMAFWINAYNALTLKSIIEKYPVSSIKKISGVWNRKKHQVMGRSLTLDDIEHKILRKQFNEPRIHMALVCASKGCPPLLNRPFTGSQLNAQLNSRAKAFAADKSKFKIDRQKGVVYLSSIFKWYGQDFEKKYKTSAFKGSAKEKASLHFLSQFAGRDAAYLKTGKYRVDYLNYDWSLNKQ